MVALFSLPSWQALAGLTDPVDLRVGAGIYYDSNLYRRTDDPAITPVLPVESDVVQTVLLGGRVDVTPGRQQIVVDAEVMWNRYNKHSDLNYNNQKASAYWYWKLGSRFSGTLSYMYNQRASNLADYNLGEGGNQNMEKIHNLSFDAEAKVGGGWRVVASLGRVMTRNSLERIKVSSDINSNSFSLGFGYNTRAGNHWRLRLRRTDGEYPHRTTLVKSRRTDIALSGIWQVTAKSNLAGQIAYTQREYAGSSDRNFSGLTGFLRYAWTPTVKLQFLTEFGYDLSEQQQIYSDFARVPRFRISGAWAPTHTLLFQASWEWRRYIFSGRDSAISEVFDGDRRDTNNTVSISARYMPIEQMIFDLYYMHSSRSTTMPMTWVNGVLFGVSDFTDDIVGLNITAQF